MRRVSAGGDPNATTKPMPEPTQPGDPDTKSDTSRRSGRRGRKGGGEVRRHGCGVGQLSRRLKLAVKLWQTATEKDEENCNRRKQQGGGEAKAGRQGEREKGGGGGRGVAE